MYSYPPHNHNIHQSNQSNYSIKYLPLLVLFDRFSVDPVNNILSSINGDTTIKTNAHALMEIDKPQSVPLMNWAGFAAQLYHQFFIFKKTVFIWQ